MINNSLEEINRRQAKQEKLFEVLSKLEPSLIKIPININTSQNHKNPWFEAIKFIWLPKNSRRRLTLQINNQQKLGLFATKSHEIIEISSCEIATDAINYFLPKLQKFLIESGSLIFKQAIITEFDSGIDLQLILSEKPSARMLQQIFDFAKNSQVNCSYRQEPTKQASSKNSAKNSKNLTFASEQILIWQKNLLQIGNFKIEVKSDVFIQATKSGFEAILDELKTQLKTRTTKQLKKIIELYSGFGAYSFGLHEFAEYFEVYEGNEEMVEIAIKNVANQSLKGKIKAFSRDIARFPLPSRQLSEFDCLIINPPRTGAAKQIAEIAKICSQNNRFNILKNGSKSSFPFLLYVSCNPQSFVFDSKILLNSGFKLSSLVAIDQFYFDEAFELVASFDFVGLQSS
jgi:23S rRNA (uracil1939-C5)-methyltransferase